MKAKEKEMHPVEIMIEIIRREKFYMAKAIDCFADKMKVGHQRGVLDFLVEKVPNAKWEKRLNDQYQWIELLKSIMFHYSGRDDIKTEPSRQDLIALLEEYLESKEFTMADNDADNEGAPSFTESLGEM